jgi:hypothetical protein
MQSVLPPGVRFRPGIFCKIIHPCPMDFRPIKKQSGALWESFYLAIYPALDSARSSSSSALAFQRYIPPLILFGNQVSVSHQFVAGCCAGELDRRYWVPPEVASHRWTSVGGAFGLRWGAGIKTPVAKNWCGQQVTVGLFALNRPFFGTPK